MTTKTRKTKITTPTLQELRALFNGKVVASDDPRYESARTVFYGGIDRGHLLVPGNNERVVDVMRRVKFDDRIVVDEVEHLARREDE